STLTWSCTASALCELQSGIPAAESQIVSTERPLLRPPGITGCLSLKRWPLPKLTPIDLRSLSKDFLQRKIIGYFQSAVLPKEPTVPLISWRNSFIRVWTIQPCSDACCWPTPPRAVLAGGTQSTLADALLRGDLEKSSRILVQQQQDRAWREQERIHLFSADPFDLKAQAKIEEDTRQQNIEENMTIAMEDGLESFCRVVVLYINWKVTGHPLKAFADSGAQMTIMSQACAERVHLVQVKIEGDFLACSFSILEEEPMDMVLALDTLKWHQCSTDLKRNVLRELPECVQLAYVAGQEEIRPKEVADQELAEALQKSVEGAETGVGPRTEKRGKETASLGMSSLPTSGGFNHQAHPSGQSPEIGNPIILAHSVSASVYAIKPSDPDSIEPKAVKALKTSAEFQITSEKKVHLPLQDLSDCASSTDNAPANQSPGTPLQNSLEEKSAERSTQGLKSHLHTRQEARLFVTATRMQEPQRLISENGWHPEYQYLSQVNGLQQHEEPRNEQHEVIQQNAPHDQEHLYNRRDLERLGEKQQNQQRRVDLEATMKGDSLQQNGDLPGTEKNILPSGCFGCSNSETLVEVDTVEQSLVAVLISAGSQNTNVKNIGASDLTLDNPLMEVETSECSLSPEMLSNSISTQDLQLLESNVEILCGSGQPSAESTEESCSSITAALKELHELLVINKNTSEEVICQSEIVTKGQTGIKDLSERWSPNEHLTATQSEQCSQVSFHQAISVSVKTEQLTDTSTDAGVEDVENINFRGPCDSLLTASEEDALNQTSEQTESLSSSITLVKDSSQCTQNPVTDRTETRENVLKLQGHF
ncbi:hypothetical protein E2I00_002713, partial [Balaenoptera physalus]